MFPWKCLTIVLDTIGRFTFAMCLVALGQGYGAGPSPRIVPLRTNMIFSAHAKQKYSSAVIRSINGREIYALSLEPDFDVGHHVVRLELMLRWLGDTTNARNLLDATGREHGLQSFDFAADDLARGVSKSAFGENRTVLLRNLGLIVRVNRLPVAVSPVAAGQYQLEHLEVQIRIDNLIP
jgi:hypothetical protein